jgi:hypothetical protein
MPKKNNNFFLIKKRDKASFNMIFNGFFDKFLKNKSNVSDPSRKITEILKKNKILFFIFFTLFEK